MNDSQDQSFFLGPEGKIIKDSARLLLTKNPTRSVSCPWCQVHCISFGPVRHECLYCKVLKIIETHKPYHDDNVGTQSARED